MDIIDCGSGSEAEAEATRADTHQAKPTTDHRGDNPTRTNKRRGTKIRTGNRKTYIKSQLENV